MMSLVKVAIILLLSCYCEAYIENFIDQIFKGIQPATKYDEIPLVGSNDPQVNIGKLIQVRGAFYLHDLMTETDNGVFKLKLFEERIVLADPLAIQAIYDPAKVYKSPDFGLFNVNSFTLRGYVPSAGTSNIHEKGIKKKGMYRILALAMKRYGWVGLYNLFSKYFKEELQSIKPNEETNMEDLVDIVTLKTLTSFFFDKAFDLDPKIFLGWFVKGITFKGTPTSKPDAETIALTDKMFEYLDSTPYVKYILPKIGLQYGDWRSTNELKGEALAFCFIFAAFGLRSGLASTIPLFLNLDTSTKNQIRREAGTFFANSGLKIEDKLSQFRVTKRFALEVIRFFPPVTQVFARARKDFKLTSLQGRHHIKKGDYLIGFPYGAQRDPLAFRFPNRFTTAGNEEETKKKFFAFGGPYYQQPNRGNNKCLGQYVSLNMIQMFVAMFSRCDIDPVSDIRFTEKDPTRSVASDEPIKVKRFKCF